jgi:serine/threonine protein kinase
MAPDPFKAACPRRCCTYAAPPKFWDCVQCKSKTWQPDDDSGSCFSCEKPVAKFSRHHCRMCGYVTCAACTKFLVFIPEWGNEKQKVCRRCATPADEPCVATGVLQKQDRKRLTGAEKFQPRWFELRGLSLMYGKHEAAGLTGCINLTAVKVLDNVPHEAGFCLIGPRLHRGIVLKATGDEDKARWVNTIRAQVARLGPVDGDGVAGGSFDHNGTGGSMMSDVDDAFRDDHISIHSFELLAVVGAGTFGTVLKVANRATRSTFAMKVVEKEKVAKMKMTRQHNAEQVVLHTANHPFICKLHHAFQTRKHLVLILDFLCGGELFFHLQRCRRFPESRARFYAAEIASAVDHLHGRDMLHRDIKPENIMLSASGHATLIDFGLAKLEVPDLTSTFCGTPEYMAPEVVLRNDYGKAADWWALGVVLYEMAAGALPFYDAHLPDMYKKILHQPLAFPAHFSAELQHLLACLLERDPTYRITSYAAFKDHAFFKRFDFADMEQLKLVPEFVPDVETAMALRYFEKDFTQRPVAVPALDLPHERTDAADPFRRFGVGDCWWDVTGPPTAGSASAASPVGDPPSADSVAEQDRQRSDSVGRATATPVSGRASSAADSAAVNNASSLHGFSDAGANNSGRTLPEQPADAAVRDSRASSVVTA